MRNLLKVTMSVAFVAFVATTFSQPASATNKTQAEGMCKKNPGCSNQGDGFMVVTADGGKMTTIFCPSKGPCVIMTARGSNGSVRAGNIQGVLQTDRGSARGKDLTGAASGGKTLDAATPGSFNQNNAGGSLMGGGTRGSLASGAGGSGTLKLGTTGQTKGR